MELLQCQAGEAGGNTVAVSPEANPRLTAEGAPACLLTPEQELRRSVCACLLWENEFYEDGKSIAARIHDLVPKVRAERVAELAIEVRSKYNLRHVPLWLTLAMVRAGGRHKALVGSTLEAVIQRADEMGEFLAMYWKDGKVPLAAQVKKGLRRAFGKFNAYALAKYDSGQIRPRDVMFLTHPRPGEERQELYRQVANKQLSPPDTWEVAISACGGNPVKKKAAWERLLGEDKLGALALLRNLRNMQKVGVDDGLIRSGLERMNPARVLPFRFIAALDNAPAYAALLEAKMLQGLEGAEKLKGRTIVLVDVSGSMEGLLSSESDLRRIDAAAGLAVLCRELGDCRVFTFSERLVEVPAFRGLGLVKGILESQEHEGTRLGEAVRVLSSILCDRLIVITDEQSHDKVERPMAKGYLINVASNKNGVGYGRWIHIDGFSEAVVTYIIELEEGGNEA